MANPKVGPVVVHTSMAVRCASAGGRSHSVGYQGAVSVHTSSGYNSFVAGIVDIEALRQFRTMNLNSNWMKDLRTEVFRRMYEEPIHPANLWLDRDPASHAEVDEVYRGNIRKLVERGSYTQPAGLFPGVRYIPAGDAGWQ